ncbi:hypothetical protein Pmani_039895 [Petrolisthes manimaculis]|uniref:Uncharacterized protein n=1 Tax=Petrolisthes manimaculis TaxID=1843537 RepID=A0AAE1NBU4_9EUCA|nr:hypothetical protein Pmani_039895 [Petrolisthes manimaculis]
MLVSSELHVWLVAGGELDNIVVMEIDEWMCRWNDARRDKKVRVIETEAKKATRDVQLDGEEEYNSPSLM